MILSKTEKKARKIEFSPATNLLTGENDVGKSTLIKILYNTLGADVPQLNNTRWKRAKAVCCVKFALGGKDYYIIRDEKFFGVFDANRELISRHVGLSGERGIAHFLNPLLKFRIELERKEDSKLGLAGPSFYYLPFYIDQDNGWTASWASFNGLQQFTRYRTNMLEYHLGVRPQRYYDAKRKSVEIEDELHDLGSRKDALLAVRDSYHKRKAARQVDLDPAVFRKEIEQLVDEYNAIYGRQQDVLHKLKQVRNERYGLESEISILRRAIKELEGDYAYAEDPKTPNPVGCPTCGTEIENSIVERFGILDDIDNCYALIDQRRKKLVDVQANEQTVDAAYREVRSELSSVDQLLRRQRENVTFAEFVTAEGIKEVMSSLSEDINVLSEQESDRQASLDALKDDLKVDSKHKKAINEHYQARMKEFLAALNVHVLELSDYKSYDRQIKANALGSDLPRSLLAQCMAFLHTMEKFNHFTLCPLIIDSPLQQDQDKDNAETIFRFIFSRTLPGQQLILGTVALPGVPDDAIPGDTRNIELTGKYGLLIDSDYATVSSEIGEMHEITLGSD
ncbi:putative phage protein [Methyloceanibacter caenitepidi]|uniref:Putative phage protein n=1 Tax=Methyloceanibacter caenitepidi TaxID=1384459 RepID=A0A0A8K124_9HYPH|nr:putative phage protein [Methyloceanibacter caenitepidi]